MTHVIGTPAYFNYDYDTSGHRIFPQDWAAWNAAPFSLPSFYLDSTRHSDPGMGKVEAARKDGTNMLFVDGHSDKVSTPEAYDAIRAPGSSPAEFFYNGGTQTEFDDIYRFE